MTIKPNTILQGDALEKLKELPNESINCVMTSPPYWALRDYGTDVETIWDGDEKCEHDFKIVENKNPNDRGGYSQFDNKGIGAFMGKELTTKPTYSGFCDKCGAWKGQLGLEPTFDLYIKHLCDIFDEVKRVLRKDGTCWVNLGDTYYGGGGGNYKSDSQIDTRTNENIHTTMKWKDNYQSKSLVMIPQRFAIEMVNCGWILRNTIIWHKPNCMPSSVKDRFTVDFEYIFFFTKNKKYWFETQREKRKYDYDKTINYDEKKNPTYGGLKITKEDRDKIRNRGIKEGFKYDKAYNNPEGRNKRTVWQICPQPFGEYYCTNCGHFDKLLLIQEEEGYFGGKKESKRKCKGCGKELTQSHFAIYPEELCETPIKSGCPKNGIVLDPFFGAGTTGLVALKQNKKFIGIELNQEYIEIAKKRLKPFLEQTKLDIKP